MRGSRLREPERSIDIGMKQSMPLRFGNLLDRASHLSTHASRREAENVDPPFAVDDGLNQGDGGGAIREVDHMRRGAKLLRGLLHACGIQVGEIHARPA